MSLKARHQNEIVKINPFLISVLVTDLLGLRFPNVNLFGQ